MDVQEKLHNEDCCFNCAQIRVQYSPNHLSQMTIFFYSKLFDDEITFAFLYDCKFLLFPVVK